MSVETDLAMTDIIYVRLLDEGTEVYRPVHATKIADNAFLLEPTPHYDPEMERWEFPPNSVVTCELKELSNGVVLIAVAAIPQ
jgi:hypothetical protein